MAIAKIEPTGCGEFHGNVKVRLAFYLEPGDARYDERHYLVPIIPASGYPDEVDERGNPLDLEEYQRWEDSLPKKWVLAPFHNHFLYLPPDVTEDIIVSRANLHLPNFYAAWLQELDKIKGGMRKGWATETRGRPTRYDRTDPELYKLRKPQCLAKAEFIKALALGVRRENGGQLFPSTEIDIGADAIDRNIYHNGGYTLVGMDNPANGTGTIDEVEIYFYSNAESVEVATFSASGNDLTTRDSEAIGSVTAGSKQTFSSLDMDVATGDYLGTYNPGSTAGRIESWGVGAGAWWLQSDEIPCSSETFSVYADYIISLYGTGETPAVGIQDKSANMGAKMIAGKLI